MIVNATDLKNNLGKYIRDAVREDIIITSNGRKVAKLSAYNEAAERKTSDSFFGESMEAYQLPAEKVTYEEFLDITEKSEDRYEYIDGEMYLLASPKMLHQRVLGRLFYIFTTWFMGKKCTPVLAPCDITLKRSETKINVVQPDMMVICDMDEKLNDKGYYMGVPSLVVEILSEGTRGKDLVKKLDLYMSTGVKEYWIINPCKKNVTVYQFENEDIIKYDIYQMGESAISNIFEGFGVNVKEVF